MKSSVLSSLFAISIALSTGLIANHAEAANTPPCTVTYVGWSDGYGGTVQIACGGSYYYGFGGGSACTAASIESRKAWLSLAESALLSGKQLIITYASCTGGPSINTVALQ